MSTDMAMGSMTMDEQQGKKRGSGIRWVVWLGFGVALAVYVGFVLRIALT